MNDESKHPIRDALKRAAIQLAGVALAKVLWSFILWLVQGHFDLF